MPQQDSPRPLPLAIVLVLVTGLGVISGIVGAAFGATRFVSPVLSEGALFSFLQRQRDDLSPAALAAALESSRQATVFFVPKAAGLDQAVASGTVFTSDGWLVSHRAGFSERQLARPAELEAVIGRRRYAVEKIAVDPYSQAVFLKVSGAHFPVASLAPDSAALAGQTLFAYDASFGLHRVAVLRRGPQAMAAGSGAEQSSERLQTFLWAAGADLPAGTVLLTERGESAGIVVEAGEDGLMAAPFALSVAGAGSVLRGRAIDRPALGAEIVPTEIALLQPDEPAPPVGARVTGIARRSAAEAAGLAVGDIVTAVSGEEVTLRRPLADILAAYAPGATVRLSVVRAGAPRTIEVVLGSTEQ